MQATTATPHKVSENSLLLAFMQLVQQCKKLVTIVLMPKTYDNH
jgi:hypothetical protein